MSIFAGAVSDKWNKKTVMLVCDSFSAVCTVAVMVLLKNNSLQAGHLYIVNILNGFLNTVQQPASDVAITLLTPEKYYQKTSGLRSFSNSLVTIFTPVFASVLMAFAGIEAVILFDLSTFATAFVVLLLFIKIPENDGKNQKQESFMHSIKSSFLFLKSNEGILWLILFLSAINFIASVYEAVLPAMVLSKESETVLGVVNTCVGIASLTGSIIATFMPEPKSRVQIICSCLFFSMSTENFMLSFSDNPVVWCIGAFCGWIFIPLMNANMDVIFRTHIPVDMQGRIFSVRNTLQFFTIPLGYFSGGLLLDKVFEPFVSGASDNFLVRTFFGTEKGDGASLLFFVIGIVGVVVCFVFSRNRHIRKMK